MTKKQYFAFCLVLILFLVPIIELSRTVDSLQQTQEDMMSKIDSIIQKMDELHGDTYENGTPLIIIIDSQPEPTEEPESTEEPEPTEEVQQDQTTDKTPVQQQKEDYPSNYYGRLYIPDADIDVALYRGGQQEICDRKDSANIFSMRVFDGLYIADHNTQEFGKLFNVEVGMSGRIQRVNGSTINIVCTDIVNGHNTGKVIEDENGNTNLDADYIMYTCRDGWKNILICLWKRC